MIRPIARRPFLLGAAAAAAARPARAEAAPFRIGAISDMSGPFADITGPGAVVAMRMAVEDFGGQVLGRPIEVLVADHQNKADIGVGIARDWFDQHDVQMITDLINTAVALAVEDLAHAKNRVTVVTGASSSVITGAKCAPTNVHWTWNTYAIANGTANALVHRGNDTWFMIVADFAFGEALANDTASFVQAAGGRVVGHIRHPLGTTDFSSYLVQAQASGARVIAIANAGADMSNAIKSAAEFGIGRPGSGQSLAALAFNIGDARALGLEAAQGLVLTEAFYWDHDERTRAWSRRFQQHAGHMPTSSQAGTYSGVLQYLKAVQAAGTSEALTVVAKLRNTDINDAFTADGHVRADGMMVHDMYLMRVKRPADSHGDWDFYELLATVPAAQAFLPLDKTTCPLLHP